jgi:hypothetical protein
MENPADLRLWINKYRHLEIPGLIIIIVVLSIYTWATWYYFTERVPGGNDFLPRYTAFKAFLQYGYSPYSDQATEFANLMIYGRSALPGEDENRLTYPFYSILLYAPFIPMDYPLARAIFMVLLQLSLFLGVIINLDLVIWRPAIWVVITLQSWSFLFYSQARGIILGQFAILGYFSLVCSLFFLKKHRDVLAGAILVLSTIKPTLIFLVIPFLLLWGFIRKRFAFLFGFIGLLGVLTIGSFILLPTWLNEWISRMVQYSDYTVGQSPVWLLTHQVFPYLGQIGEWFIILILCSSMFFAWRQALKIDGDVYFYWTMGLTLVISNLIVSRSATTNYVMMLLITIWIFAALDREGVHGRIIVLVSMALSFLGLWWLHFATVVGNQEQPIMFIPYPLILAVVLLFARRWLLRDALQVGLEP